LLNDYISGRTGGRMLARSVARIDPHPLTVVP